MVFCGRPSTACHACRKRRLKCDRIRTGCMQCKRKNIECPGYGDASALRIRDETDRVAVRVRKAQALKEAQVMREDGPSSSAYYRSRVESRSSSSNSSRRNSRSPSPTLTPDACDMAVTYFMTSYIITSPFEGYLNTFYVGDKRAEDACTSAIYATSVAAFAHRIGIPKYLEIARGYYSTALTLTNACLADPVLALSDSTLAAVLLLALFEAIVFQGGTPPTNWLAHTNGAMQLLRMRGPRQFDTAISRQLFTHASNNIKTSCIQNTLPIPEDLLDLSAKARDLLDDHDLVLLRAPLVEKVAQIRSSCYFDPTIDLLTEAWDLDKEIVGFCQSLPPRLYYTVQSPVSIEPPGTLKGSHEYPSPHVAKLWNALRLLRLFLLGLIWGDLPDCIEPNRHKLSNSEREQVDRMIEYATENMASVSLDVLASTDSFKDTIDVDDAVLSVGGNVRRRKFAPAARSLVWPLSIVEKSILCDDSTRKTAAARLRDVAHDLNMPQAMHPDRAPGDKEDWLHLFHLS